MSEHWSTGGPTTHWSGGLTTAAPPPRRRRRWWVPLLVILLLLAGLALAADRIGDRVAQDVAATQIQKHENLSHKPTVQVHGVPFLTQLATGHYQHVTLRLSDYTATGNGQGTNQGTGQGIRISDIVIDLHSLTVSRDFSDLSAKRATAHALITYADLSTRLGSTVAYAGNGRISASRSVSVLGVDVNGTVSARPQAAPAELSFVDIQAKVEGVSVPQVAVDSLRQFFQTSVDLSGLPFGVRLTSVQATDKGLEFALTGTDLSYSS